MLLLSLADDRATVYTGRRHTFVASSFATTRGGNQIHAKSQDVLGGPEVRKKSRWTGRGLA